VARQRPSRPRCARRGIQLRGPVGGQRQDQLGLPGGVPGPVGLQPLQLGGLLLRDSQDTGSRGSGVGRVRPQSTSIPSPTELPAIRCTTSR